MREILFPTRIGNVLHGCAVVFAWLFGGLMLIWALRIIFE